MNPAFFTQDWRLSYMSRPPPQQPFAPSFTALGSPIFPAFPVSQQLFTMPRSSLTAPIGNTSTLPFPFFDSQQNGDDEEPYAEEANQELEDNEESQGDISDSSDEDSNVDSGFMSPPLRNPNSSSTRDFQSEVRGNREREEAERAEQRVEQLKKEEKATMHQVKEQEHRVKLTQYNVEIRRCKLLTQESTARNEIERLMAEVRRQESRLEEIHHDREAQQDRLEWEKIELMQAKQRAREKKAERIQATREADELPYSLSLQYNRGCSICLAENPKRRVVMVACGHMTGATCAEELAERADESTFPCPLCRKPTTYVRMFEEAKETPIQPQRSSSMRKRVNIDDVEFTYASVKRNLPGTSSSS